MDWLKSFAHETAEKAQRLALQASAQARLLAEQAGDNVRVWQPLSLMCTLVDQMYIFIAYAERILYSRAVIGRGDS
jgi:hypothetical protein